MRYAMAAFCAGNVQVFLGAPGKPLTNTMFVASCLAAGLVLLLAHEIYDRPTS